MASPPPEVERELRGVWVATVENIDWPTKPGLSVERQQAEARAILDVAAELNLNTIVFQVRPAADAMYASDIEPWSYYLTGEQGRAPEPFYDPLAYWIRESHARGMELHVWLNPYRVLPASRSYEPSADSIAKTDPGLVVDYGDDNRKQLWMNPALPEVRERTLAVFEDLVRRYDIDGVHMDDYFYPYPVAGVPWPDDAWRIYRLGGGKLGLSDFRRKGVDDLVEEIYTQTKAIKPHVKVGISPFGIWRPGNPPSIQGFDQHESLYADARKWLREGWVDYWTPQLYWPTAQVPQSYPQLLAWWHQQNEKGRTIAPGLYTGRINFNDWPVDEVVGQVLTARAMGELAGVGDGHVHFSSQALTRNFKGAAEQFRDRLYPGAALAPAMTWIDDEAPATPRVKVLREGRERAAPPTTQPSEGFGEKFDVVAFNPRPEPDSGVRVSFTPGDRDGTRWWAVQVLREESGWTTEIYPGSRRSVVVGDFDDDAVSAVAVRAVDAAGNASEAAVQSVERAPAPPATQPATQPVQ